MSNQAFFARFAGVFFIPIFSIFIALTAYAEDAKVVEEDEEVIIVEDEVSDATEYSIFQDKESYFEKHFSGGLVLSYAGFVDKTRRVNNFLRVRFQDEWEASGLSIAIVGRAINSETNLVFEKEVKAHDGSFSKKESIERNFKENVGQLREAYLRWSKSFFDIYAGRRTLAIGQFDAFSPVDAFIPVDFTNNTVSFSKVAGKYPQTTLSTILYPTGKTELQLHYFPKIERDSSFKKLLEKKVVNQINLNPEDLENPIYVERVEEFEYPKDQGQYIARFLYTGSVIWGLTYYKGYNLYPEDLTTLEDVGTLDGSTNHQFTRKIRYIPMDGYGFEIAVPFNQYTAKYEIISVKSVYSGYSCYSEDVGDDCALWKAYILKNLKGKAYFEFDTYLQALGFDYKSDNWTINFAVLQIIYSKTKEQEEAEKLSIASVGGTDKPFKSQALPIFHFAKHYGGRKSHTTGMGFGSFGAAFGVSIYHGYKYNESFTFAASADFLSYRNEHQNAELLEQDAEGEDIASQTSTSIDSVTAPSIRLTLAYEF